MVLLYTKCLWIASDLTKVNISHSVIELALGRLTQSPSERLPNIVFLSSSTELDYPEVPIEKQSVARCVVESAYLWCNERFPLTIPLGENKEHRCAINVLELRMTSGFELLSSSSADKPGHIILGAPWLMMESPYRLGSLIAHESVHQGLFVREKINSPIREGSLGYSPWKCMSRPGGLVWHAFWTFGCQFSLLAEAVTNCSTLLQKDSALVGFIASMVPRLEICLDSLQLFKIAEPDELARCVKAMYIIKAASEQLALIPGYTAQIEHEQLVAVREYRLWAESILKNYE